MKNVVRQSFESSPFDKFFKNVTNSIWHINYRMLLSDYSQHPLMKK